jgi:hypothetical protein
VLICDHQNSCSKYSGEKSAKHKTDVAESNSVSGDWLDLGYVALAADTDSPKHFISSAHDLGFLSSILLRLLCPRKIRRSQIQICRSNILGSLHFPLPKDIFAMTFGMEPRKNAVNQQFRGAPSLPEIDLLNAALLFFDYRFAAKSCTLWAAEQIFID